MNGPVDLTCLMYFLVYESYPIEKFTLLPGPKSDTQRGAWKRYGHKIGKKEHKIKWKI